MSLFAYGQLHPTSSGNGSDSCAPCSEKYYVNNVPADVATLAKAIAVEVYDKYSWWGTSGYKYIYPLKQIDWCCASNSTNGISYRFSAVYCVNCIYYPVIDF
jgi:hypothetical protein